MSAAAVTRHHLETEIEMLYCAVIARDIDTVVSILNNRSGRVMISDVRPRLSNQDLEWLIAGLMARF
jgi:hypothetical protein